jgi:hypothetical protein
MKAENYFKKGYAKMLLFRRINDYENVEYFCKFLIRPGGLKESDYTIGDGREEITIVGVLPIFELETPNIVIEEVIEYTKKLSENMVSDEKFLRKLHKIDKKLMLKIRKRVRR